MRSFFLAVLLSWTACGISPPFLHPTRGWRENFIVTTSWQVVDLIGEKHPSVFDQHDPPPRGPGITGSIRAWHPGGGYPSQLSRPIFMRPVSSTFSYFFLPFLLVSCNVVHIVHRFPISSLLWATVIIRTTLATVYWLLLSLLQNNALRWDGFLYSQFINVYSRDPTGSAS